MDFLETKVEQRHAFAGGGEERAVLSEAQRPETGRVAQHHHVAASVEEDKVVGAVEFRRQAPEHLDQVGPFLAAQAQLVAEVVHDDFGVDVARQVVIGLRQQLLAEFGEVGQLSVEGESEPFPFAAMMAFERLGVTLIVGSTGGVADVADGCGARPGPA